MHALRILAFLALEYTSGAENIELSLGMQPIRLGGIQLCCVAYRERSTSRNSEVDMAMEGKLTVG